MGIFDDTMTTEEKLKHLNALEIYIEHMYYTLKSSNLVAEKDEEMYQKLKALIHINREEVKADLHIEQILKGESIN